MTVACFSLDFIRNQTQYKNERGSKERKVEITSMQNTKYPPESWVIQYTFPFIESV